MIAVHTLLYIFQHSKKPGQGGLYRYRYLIYILWICLPLFLASIAFVNKNPPYEYFGTICYLPRRPLWYRSALSWIPRYMIMLVILFSYAAIYIYAGRKFWDIEKDLQHQDQSNSRANCRGPRRRSALEKLQYVLLIGGKDRTGLERRGSSSLPPSDTGPDSMRFITTASIVQPPDYESMSFITVSTTAQENPQSPPQPLQGISTLSLPQPVFSPQYTAASSVTQMSDYRAPIEWQITPGPVATQDWSNADEAASRRVSQMTLGKRRRSTNPQPSLEIKRLAIRKQLRYLFIYPVVYILLWIFPLVSQILQYNDYTATHQPYWLWILTAVSLSIQAAADAFILAWRERPWRRKRSPLPTWWLKLSDSVLSRLRRWASRRKKEAHQAVEAPAEKSSGAVNWWEKHEENGTRK